VSYISYLDTVQKAYIAYYQRPAESAGLRYWAEELDKVKGDQGKMIEAFANGKEATALYGPINDSTISNVVDTMYYALFGRTPEAAGKQDYVNGFKNGKYTAGSIALDILSGARNSDAKAIESKLKIANQFTLLTDGRKSTSHADFGTGKKFHVTYEGDADAATARNMLSKVISKATELSTAEIWLAAKLISDTGDSIAKDKNPTTPPPPPPPSTPPSPAVGTHNLTKNIDYIQAVTGDDVFNALLDGDDLTLQSGDSIIGKKDGKNILNVNLGNQGGFGLQNANILNIHQINIDATSEVSLGSLDLTRIMNLSDISVKTTSTSEDVNIYGGKNIITDGGNNVEVSGSALTDVTVKGAKGKIGVFGGAIDSVNVETSSPSENINIDGAKKVITDGGNNVEVSGSALTDVTVKGAKGKISVFGGAIDSVNVETSSTSEDVNISDAKKVVTDGGNNVYVNGDSLTDVTVKGAKGGIGVSGRAIDSVNVETSSASEDISIYGGKKVVADGGNNVQVYGDALTDVTVKGAKGGIHVFHFNWGVIDSVNVETSSASEDISIYGGKKVVADGGNNVQVYSDALTDVTIKNSNGDIMVAGTATQVTIDGAAVGQDTIHRINSTDIESLTLRNINSSNIQTFGVSMSTQLGIAVKVENVINVTVETGIGADVFEVAASSRVTLKGGAGDDTFVVKNNVVGDSTVANAYFTTIDDIDVQGDTIQFGVLATTLEVVSSTQASFADWAESGGHLNAVGTVYFIETQSDGYYLVYDGSSSDNLAENDVIVHMPNANLVGMSSGAIFAGLLPLG